MHRVRISIVASCLALGVPGTVSAQAQDGGTTIDRAQDIAAQPARDVGLQRREIPPVLEHAAADPYGLSDVGTCARIAAAVIELNGVLGADFDAPPARESSDAGRIAEAGGRALVNSVIPFRGVVRELSGAASADRRLEAAVEAGIARRGFLRGVHRARGCRTSLESSSARP